MTTAASPPTLPDWLSSMTFIAYLAGLATAIGIGIATFLGYRYGAAVVRGGRKGLNNGVHWVVDVWRGKGRKGHAIELAVEPAEKGQKARMKCSEEGQKVKTGDCKKIDVMVAPRPFGFRERLWYEPPEDRDMPFLDGTYEERFGHFDKVQRKFKAAGGKDLEWKTNWLDFISEEWLLQSYRQWASNQAKNVGQQSKGDEEFYRELEKDLETEVMGVVSERYENNRRFGHSNDEEQLWAVLDQTGTEAHPGRRPALIEVYNEEWQPIKMYRQVF